MAKDDYFVLAYRLLSYLYVCLKAGEKADREYLSWNSERFPIGERYWQYLFTNLYLDGYIAGVSLIPCIGLTHKAVKLSDDLCITPKGIEYLQENSMMQKACDALKQFKEMIPGF